MLGGRSLASVFKSSSVYPDGNNLSTKDMIGSFICEFPNPTVLCSNG